MASHHIAAYLVGAVQQHFNVASARMIHLKLPPIQEQRAITQVLDGMGDRIELNQQMNKTLEEIAKAIFKHWFIDFEFPNEEGKPYKSSGGLMVFNEELGKEVPNGWSVGDLLDCANILSGGTPRTEVADYWGGDIPWVSAKDVTNSQGSFVLKTERTITRLGLQSGNAKLLPKNTTVVTARGVVGSYCILPTQMAINQTNYGLKAKSEGEDFFVFFSLAALVSKMKQHSYGTIFDTITTKTFHEMKVPIPPVSLRRSFEDKEGGIMQKVLSNLQESNTLEGIRGLLIPKLMSGQIRVPSGGKIVAESHQRGRC